MTLCITAFLAGVFGPSADTNLESLEALLAERSPTLVAEQLGVASAEADLARSRVFENPQLALTLGNIPLGETNPKDLCNGIGADCAGRYIMNYGASLSYRFELGKRGNRQTRERETLTATRATLEFATRMRALDLARLLGKLAVITLRRAASGEVLGAARAFAKLTEQRASSGFVAPMELDRLEIDIVRIENAILADEADEQAALAQCSAIVASSCTTFATAADARAFLDHWLQASVDKGWLHQRADIRALDGAIRAARADKALSEMRALPDPTLSIGYLHDRFTVSGNQLNALTIGVSIPLPFFDHGQADAAAAAARAERLEKQRELLLAANERTIEALEAMVARQAGRRQTIREKMLPKAQALVANLEKAVAAKALPLSDLQQARRALFELLEAEADAAFDGFNAKLDLLAVIAQEHS